eukprot:PhF_6_TR7897/c0_g1_i2/m.11645
MYTEERACELTRKRIMTPCIAGLDHRMVSCYLKPRKLIRRRSDKEGEDTYTCGDDIIERKWADMKALSAQSAQDIRKRPPHPHHETVTGWLQMIDARTPQTGVNWVIESARHTGMGIELASWLSDKSWELMMRKRDLELALLTTKRHDEIRVEIRKTRNALRNSTRADRDEVWRLRCLTAQRAMEA